MPSQPSRRTKTDCKTDPVAQLFSDLPARLTAKAAGINDHYFVRVPNLQQRWQQFVPLIQIQQKRARDVPGGVFAFERPSTHSTCFPQCGPSLIVTESSEGTRQPLILRR